MNLEQAHTVLLLRDIASARLAYGRRQTAGVNALDAARLNTAASHLEDYYRRFWPNDPQAGVTLEVPSE